MLPIEKLQQKIQGKKVAFIGAGVSHKRCLEQFVEMGAQVTLCDQKKSVEDFGEYAETLRRLNVRLSLGEHYTDGFAGQDIIMRTPGYEYYKPELQAALQAVRPGGIVSAILYSGAVIGSDEKQAVLRFLRALPLKSFTVLVCDFANWAETAPLPCLILKK